MCGIFAFLLTNGSFTPELKQLLESEFYKFQHRGPDHSSVNYIDDVMLGFHRLAIIDPTDHGMQPFRYKDLWGVTNGEIYNWTHIRKELESCEFHSKCDCEVILPAFDEYGRNVVKLAKRLDGEYATVIYDSTAKKLHVISDELRIRSLFIGKYMNPETGQTGIAFSSEMIALSNWCYTIAAFPSRSYWSSEMITATFPYYQLPDSNTSVHNYRKAVRVVRDLLTKSVEMKYESRDVPVGFLLSGGLDSSLVCALAQRDAKRHGTRIRTFSMGFDRDSVDLKAARKVAEFLGTDHTELVMSVSDGVAALPEVIKALGTYDQTTIRAATGMYLICQWIRKNTDIKCILSGELADELFQGYIYWKYQPTSEAGHEESKRRLIDIYYFDALRADRCNSAASLECRFPFFNRDLINFVLSLDPDFLNPRKNDGIEKKLLRDAFNEPDDPYLPDEILWRTKEAFSNGVSSKNEWIEAIQEFCESHITEEDWERRWELYSYLTPRNKEEFYYRQVFEKNYPSKNIYGQLTNCERTIPYRWLPKVEWLPEHLRNENIDSSAAALTDIYVKN